MLDKISSPSFLTVVIGDGDGGAVDPAHLGTVGRVEQLDLKVFVLLKLHVVHDRDVQCSVSLRMGHRGNASRIAGH